LQVLSIVHQKHNEAGLMRRTLAYLAAALLAATPALAHHSPAAYDIQTTVAFDGTVTRFEWANPHVYLSVQDAAGGRTWLVELISPSALKEFGWTPTTLASGDRVKVVAYPGRNAARGNAFLVAVEKGGTVLYDTRSAMRASGLREAGSAALATAAGSGAAAASAARATSVAGTWSTQAGPALGQLLANSAALPVTPRGAELIRTFKDAESNPGRDCVPFAPPVYMILPVYRSIEIGAGAVIVRGEEGDVNRTIHLDRTSHDGAAASVLGDSIGHFENGVLVVDTASFAEHPIGNGAGLPSSPRKHLVERFEVAPDGKSLVYTFVLEDPEYLTEPVRGMAPWVYRPDVKYAAIPCNLETARRFLDE
jgi:hypothetical protein